MKGQELEQAMLDWMMTVLRLSMHDLSRFTHMAGLSLSQMNVLLHLYHQGVKEVMDFAELMQVSPAGASQMIERMVQQGLVRRVELMDDRRVRQVHLTEYGRTVVENSLLARREWIDRLSSTFSDEEKIQVVCAIKLLTGKARELEA